MREWGPWTLEKLRILEAYLPAFTLASSSRSSERVYLDTFAGEGAGRARLTGEPFDGSPRIALKTNPPFTHVVLFELDGEKARALRAELAYEFPGRDIRVYPGDCNETIPTALDDLVDVAWAPAFAFLDPDGMELRWPTIEAISRHRRSRQGFRVEMWILFSHQFTRTLPVRRQPTAAELHRAVEMFGTEEVLDIYRRRLEGDISPAEARALYLNLFRWRLEHELEYRWTHPITIVNTRNRPIYEMVFATCHPVGNDVMTHLYDGAMPWLPARMRRAREHEAGIDTLFPLEDYGGAPAAPVYVYVPPEDPSTF